MSNNKASVVLPLFQAPQVVIGVEDSGKSNNKLGHTPNKTHKKLENLTSEANINSNKEKEQTPKIEKKILEKRTRSRKQTEKEVELGEKGVSSISTRLETSKKRRRNNRNIARRRTVVLQADFLAKRDNVDCKIIMRENNGSEQIAILEDGILVEHYVSEQAESSIVGNVYLGQVQSVLPGMEAAFVDIGVGRNGVLYVSEVNWDVSELVDGEPKRIEHVLKKGDMLMVQVTKDPINLKGARLTSQVTFAGRYLVLVPSSGIAGISKKLSHQERMRLKAIVLDHVTEDLGIIVRTAAQGTKEEDILSDFKRLKSKWEVIEKSMKKAKKPTLLYEESDFVEQIILEQFDDRFTEIIIEGDVMFSKIKKFIDDIIPELTNRIVKWTNKVNVFSNFRIDEQLAKAFNQKVWLPSGGTLVIDHTEAMTVIDVNTGKYTGSSKNDTLEQTVTYNNLEAAEEIVRQLRLRDIGGIIIIDFVDMILSKNRDKVLHRLLECLSRDRTKHQVAEITSLGLVQLTRKRVGQGLLEAFSVVCEQCTGKGYIIHNEPIKKDINYAVSSETPEGWYDRIAGSSHELNDGSLIAKVEVDESKREANINASITMAQAAGIFNDSKKTNT